MTEYRMPDLTEYREVSGLDAYWYVDQDSPFSDEWYVTESLSVSLMSRRPAKWWERGGVKTRVIDCLSSRTGGIISNASLLIAFERDEDIRRELKAIPNEEWVAREAVKMAERILNRAMAKYKDSRTDVNGLTGAEFSPRIKHSGVIE